MFHTAWATSLLRALPGILLNLLTVTRPLHVTQEDALPWLKNLTGLFWTCLFFWQEATEPKIPILKSVAGGSYHIPFLMGRI